MEPDIMLKIQNLFKQKPNIVYEIPYSIRNYKDVVKLFHNYKLTKNVDFYDQDSIISGTNINILIPSELSENNNKNILAIYA